MEKYRSIARSIKRFVTTNITIGTNHKWLHPRLLHRCYNCCIWAAMQIARINSHPLGRNVTRSYLIELTKSRDVRKQCIRPKWLSGKRTLPQDSISGYLDKNRRFPVCLVVDALILDVTKNQLGGNIGNRLPVFSPTRVRFLRGHFSLMLRRDWLSGGDNDSQKLL